MSQAEIRDSTANLLGQAIHWWAQFRPPHWTEEQHLDDPLVNVPAGTAECQLAWAVADTLRALRKCREGA